MKRILGLLFLLACIQAQAQTKDAVNACVAEKLHLRPGDSKPAVADIREEDYDVKYVKLDIELSNLNTKISGSATTKARSRVQNLSEYVFELIPECTIDSVKINGVLSTATGAGVARTVSLPFTVALNDVFTAQVWYHGEPVDPNRGIRNQYHGGWNAYMTYTISEPYSANNWWPCKQALKDKIDSSDVWITVPQNLKAGSNGLLEQVTAMPGGSSRYEWKSRKPIDYYLISAAVAPYQDYSFYVHFDNSTDSMLVQNYIYDHPDALLTFKEQMDSTAIMINFYSGFLGRYPFWKEKYGHCLTTLGGGMEHQTMTTLGNFGYMLVAHELAHQWFGNNVTAASWNDIWIGESFATYLAWMFMDYSRGDTVSFADMQYIHDEAMAEPGGSVYCTDTTSVGRIFSGRLSYNKGAAVIHSLRKLINNDDLFFQLLRQFQHGYAGRNASTAQFQSFAESITNMDLDTFFNEWIYGEGYPIYNAWWNQDVDQVTVLLKQEGSMPSSVPFFTTPLEIKLYGGGTDTTVSVYNNADLQQFTFSWNKTVDSIALDPRNHIMNRTDSIKLDHSLKIDGFDTNLFVVYPNPGTDYWFVDGMPLKSDLYLSDSQGRTVWRGTSGNYHSVKVDARELAHGLYWLHIGKEGKEGKTLKLLKKE